MDTIRLFRERLQQLILDRYPSIDRFYLETGFSKGHLSNILRGARNPSTVTLLKLAEVLEIEGKDFFIFPKENRRHQALKSLAQCSEAVLTRVIKILPVNKQHGD